MQGASATTVSFLVTWPCNSFAALVFVLNILGVGSPALAEKGKLRERLTPAVMAVVYPMAMKSLGPGGGITAGDRGLPGRQGRRLSVLDVGYHRAARLFDNAIRRDRRR